MDDDGDDDRMKLKLKTTTATRMTSFALFSAQTRVNYNRGGGQRGFNEPCQQ